MTTTSGGSSLPSTSSSEGTSSAQGVNFPGAAPFFANPFMAPFMPQQPVGLDGRTSISPTSSPSPNDLNGVPRADFRVNPLTGGYFLSPAQYQQMMQDYMQLMMSASNPDSSQQPREATLSTATASIADFLTNGSAFATPPGAVNQPAGSSSSSNVSAAVSPPLIGLGVQTAPSSSGAAETLGSFGSSGK
ncbi:hypothetical protein M3Y99_00797700 [Aphelenchoides fujianensis]|nr:hypothetical protein M3Y99_00797700 [Aphelenchoides fujianensis]